jgi:hypothetical protein
MIRKLSQVVRSCLLVLLFVALASATSGLRPAAADPASSTQTPSASTTPGAVTTVTCDFSNPGYSGWCRVTKQLQQGKRPRGFCTQVLACLNDVRCIRTYCDATTIRGGWKLEKVEAAGKAQ